LLDTDTPVLNTLLIKGGHVIFDRKDVHLQAKNILIMNNGSLQVGTEAQPFEHKAQITLHGHVRSTEIPVYGAKSISLRTGYLGLHGLHIKNTWTKLAKTVEPGETQMEVTLSASDWKVGSEIVIASTSKSMRENEVLHITGISNGGKTIAFKPALKYKHVAITQTIEGRIIETAAEIGLLSRNVVVRGSFHDEWDREIEACPKEFDPDQFQAQTCFEGRYGEERGSDQFGVQIIIHSDRKNLGLAVAHFNHIEVTHAGQAFRIGRYPIHFHMEGDVHESYVKGCAIHRSFNRAVTMHGVHNLVVERNVIYDILGMLFIIYSLK